MESVTFGVVRLFACFVLIFGAVWNVAAEAPHDISGATTINLVEAHRLHQEGAVFVDVRDPATWSMGHIQNAVNLDFNDDMFVILYVSDELEKDTPLVFYCDSALAPSAAMASYFAASWGYENVYFFRDGYYAWMASDLPVDFQVAHSGTL